MLNIDVSWSESCSSATTLGNNVSLEFFYKQNLFNSTQLKLYEIIKFVVLMSLSNLIETMHNIYKVWDLNPTTTKKKRYSNSLQI